MATVTFNIDAAADDTVQVKANGVTGNPYLQYNGTANQWEYSNDGSSASALSGLADIVSDTTPQLGGNLDVLARSITTSTSNGNITLAPNGTGSVVISGNLQVDGTTTTTNSTTVTIDDPVFTIGGDAAPSSDDNKDRGIEFRYHTGSAAKVGFFGYDDSTGRLTYIPDATNSSEVFSGTKGDIDVSKVYTSNIGAFTLDGKLTAGSTEIEGSNFDIDGGDIASGVTINKSPVITLGGDLSGNVTLTNLASGTLTATVADGSITVATLEAASLVIESEGIGSNDNDTTIPTSAAVKDYVDTTLTASDLDFSTSTGAGSVDLDSQTLALTAGEGIDITHANQTVTFGAEDATASNKGIASFSSDDFSVSSGAVTLADLTTAHLSAATLVIESEGISSNDNDTTLPTSAAVKDYVDTRILTEDTITELNDTNIASISTAQLLIYNGTSSLWENKTLAGDVTIAANGTTTIGSGVIIDADISGSASIAQSKVDLAITTTQFASGIIITQSAGIGSNDNETTLPTSAAVKDYVDNNIELSGDSSPQLGGNLDLLTHSITTSTTNGNITLTPNGTGKIVINGPLQVDGTTTTVNSTTVTVDDPIFTLGGDTAPTSDDNKDRGIEFRYYVSSSAKIGFFGYDDSTNRFTFIPDASNSSEVFSGTKGDVDINKLFTSNISAFTLDGKLTAGSNEIEGSAFDIDGGDIASGVTINKSPVITLGGDLTGNVTLTELGNGTLTAAIASDVIVNADINSSAAIADSKLATISTADKVSGSAVQLASTSAIEDSTGLRVKSAVAGTGLTLTSQVLSVDAAQTQITSVGTIGTGTWEGTDVGVAHGGTGASNAGTARTNLGLVIGTNVAAAGANSDITALTGLTTDLAVAYGGTGASTFTANGILLGNGTSAIAASAAMTTNGTLLIGGTGGPEVATITAGSNVTVTNGDGTITIAASASGNSFETISVSGQSDVVADSVTDTLTLVAGSNITITTNASSDTVTINSTASSSVSAFTDLSDVGTTTPTSGKLMIADGDSWESVAVSGDATLASGGALTIANNAVSLAKLAGLARGKIIYGDASGDPAALAVGTNGYVLTSDGTDISWAEAAGGQAYTGATSAPSSPSAGDEWYDTNSAILYKRVVDSSSNAVWVDISGSSAAGGMIASLETTSIGTSVTTIQEFGKNLYRSAKMIVEVTDVTNTAYRVSEVLILHDGTNAHIVEYGVAHSGASDFATLTADISGANVRLRCVGTSVNNTAKVVWTKVAT